MRLTGVIGLCAAALVLLNSGTASAQVEYTVLCPTAPSEAEECPEENEPYYEGTEITAKSTDLLVTIQEVTFGVDAEIECDSEIKMATNESYGEPLLDGEAEAFTLTSCEDDLSRKCTATVAKLPYEATLEASEASAGDGFLFLSQGGGASEPGATMVCEDANPFTTDINCTYTVDENDEQIGGGATDLAKLAVDGEAKASASITAGTLDEAAGSKCPGAEPTLDATYAIEAPEPLFMAAQIKWTELCEESKANPCTKPYASNTVYRAQLVSGDKVSFLYENKKEEKSFSCTSANLKGKIGSIIGPQLGAPLESWEFSNCSNECLAVMNTPLNDTRFEATKGGNGYLWAGKKGAGPAILVSCKGDFCVYTSASIVGQVTGGAPATMTVGGKLGFKVGTSEKECGAALYYGGLTYSMSATYKFTEPVTKGNTVEMWVGRN